MMKIYKFSSNQITFKEVNHPIGMNSKQTIRNSSSDLNGIFNPYAWGELLIQTEYRYSYEETAEQIKESPHRIRIKARHHCSRWLSPNSNLISRKII